MLLFSFSIVVLRRFIVLVSSGLRLLMHSKAVGGRFCRIFLGQIVAAS
jgi:hypothetical protein